MRSGENRMDKGVGLSSQTFSNESCKKKRMIWVIDGSLNAALHKNARIKPAAELCKIGWRVCLVTSERPIDHNVFPMEFYEVNWPRIYFFGAVLYYFTIIKRIIEGELESDILFFQMDSMSLMLLIVPMIKRLGFLKRCNTVIDFRSLPMDQASLKGKLRGFVFNFGMILTKLLNINFTAITKQLVEYIGLDKRKLQGIWPSGADIEDFQNCYYKRLWPNENGPIKLLYLGTITEERNIDSLIEAVRIARKNGINVILNIVGDGKHKRKLGDMLKDSDEKIINIEGPIPYTMVPDLLSINHIGILPFPDTPKMNVSSAIKMFEYLAAGMPIIATRIKAHSTVLENNPFVFWANENAESMALAIDAVNIQKNNLKELGEQSMAFSVNWSWKNSAGRLDSALKKVLN